MMRIVDELAEAAQRVGLEVRREKIMREIGYRTRGGACRLRASSPHVSGFGNVGATAPKSTAMSIGSRPAIKVFFPIIAMRREH